MQYGYGSADAFDGRLALRTIDGNEAGRFHGSAKDGDAEELLLGDDGNAAAKLRGDDRGIEIRSVIGEEEISLTILQILTAHAADADSCETVSGARTP